MGLSRLYFLISLLLFVGNAVVKGSKITVSNSSVTFPQNLNVYISGKQGRRMCVDAFILHPNKQLAANIQWFKGVLQNKYTGNNSYLFRPFVNMRSAVYNSSMVMLNMGAEGTDTKVLHNHFCSNSNMRLIHQDSPCNGFIYSSERYPIVDWYAHLMNCATDKSISRTDECLSAAILETLKTALLDSYDGNGGITGLQGASDAPLAIIYPYMYSLIGEQLQLVFQTVKDPAQWLKTTKEKKNFVGMICNPLLWEFASHPFDLLGCINKKRYVIDAIFSYSRMLDLNKGSVEETDKIFGHAYRWMNTYNAMITPPNKHHIICVADHREDSNAAGFLDADTNTIASVFAQPIKKISIHPIPPFPNNLNVYLYDPAIKRTCVNGFNMSISPKLQAHVNWHKSYMAGIVNVGNSSRIYANLRSLKRNLEDTSLRTINAGAGTTGTRELHRYNCKELGKAFVHYDVGCNGFNYSEEKYPLVKWFTKDLYFCVIVKRNQRSRACMSGALFEKFKTSMIQSFRGSGQNPMYGVSDTPLCAIYPYLLPLIGDKLDLIVQSIRDSVAWWKSRWEHHGGHVGLICHPSLWSSVPHPFDFVGCLMKRKYASEALVNYPRLKTIFNDTKRADDSMVQAFASMNTYNALISPPEKHHIVCLWDHDQADANPFTFEDDRQMRSWLLGEQFRQPFFSYPGKPAAFREGGVKGVEVVRLDEDDAEGDDLVGKQKQDENGEGVQQGDNEQGEAAVEENETEAV